MYIAIVGTLDKFWAKICEVLGFPECAQDERFRTTGARYANRDLVVRMMTEQLVKKDCEEWIAAFRKVKVPCGPVNPLDKALGEPLLLARNMVVDVERGGEKIKLLGNPVKMSDSRECYAPAPRLGEHTNEIFSGMLGMDTAEIEALRREAVIR
jgi:crotonobetainyl-CoA:carnitine CoA-transferase CaiB-like acyl-CoA transferase